MGSIPTGVNMIYNVTIEVKKKFLADSWEEALRLAEKRAKELGDADGPVDAVVVKIQPCQKEKI